MASRGSTRYPYWHIRIKKTGPKQPYFLTTTWLEQFLQMVTKGILIHCYLKIQLYGFDKKSPKETICMKYQILFSGKNKKTIINLSSADFAHRVELACPLDSRPQRNVQVRPDTLEVVAAFCYQEDMLSAASGSELSTTTLPVKKAWKTFKELLPVLSSHHLSFKTCGSVYNFCVRSTMLHASETWPLTEPNSAEWSDGSAMSSHKTLSPSCPMSYLHSLALRIWTSFWRREGSTGMDTWNTPKCSQDSLLHTGWWKAWAWETQDDTEAADREGPRRMEALGYRPSW